MHPGTAHWRRSTAASLRADSKAGNPTGAASAPWMMMPGLMRTLTAPSRAATDEEEDAAHAHRD